MTFTREHVRMSGILRGGGRVANCMVSAMRVTLSGTRLFKDCMYSVDWVSRSLPDGDYKLSVDGMAVYMRYSKGCWRARLTIESVKVQLKSHRHP
jgi:hypothetical protein